MSWQPCWMPAIRYGTNLWMEPLSWMEPDTPCATFTLSPSLQGKARETLEGSPSSPPRAQKQGGWATHPAAERPWHRDLARSRPARAAPCLSRGPQALGEGLPNLTKASPPLQGLFAAAPPSLSCWMPWGPPLLPALLL